MELRGREGTSENLKKKKKGRSTLDVPSLTILARKSLEPVLNQLSYGFKFSYEDE